jgi:hypothetical protein
MAPGPDLRVGDADREAAAAALGEHFASVLGLRSNPQVTRYKTMG